MRAAQMRKIVALLSVVGALVLAPALIGTSAAEANPRIKKKIAQKTKQALEAFTILEFEEAKKTLSQTIVLAKKKGLGSAKVTARAYLALGIVELSGFKDKESARMAFIEAVTIDSNIQIDPAYRSKETKQLLESVRKEFGGGGGGSDGGSDASNTSDSSDDVDCGSLESISHTLVDTAKAGSDKEIFAHVSAALKAKKISLYYRPKGKADFVEVKMTKKGECKYVGKIPSEAIRGEFLHYYVAAYNKKGKLLASKGSSGSPNIIETEGAAGGGSDGTDEDPFGNKGGKGSGGGISKGSGGGSSSSGPKMFLAVAVGSGGGYVTGVTEQEQNAVGCCFAPALLHVFPELGYYISKQTSISAAFRMGFTVGANRMGHATAAPAAFLRLRYALDKSGDGLQVNGSIGGGIIRHVVTLRDVTEGEGDADTTASGPVFLGGGLGYSKRMGGPIRFIAEVNALAGLPVADLGEVKPNFAVQFDVNMGLLFAF